MDLTPLLLRSAIRGWVSSHALSYKKTSYLHKHFVKPRQVFDELTYKLKLVYA